MYNLFERKVHIVQGANSIYLMEYKVYKADNKNTLRRLRGEGWKKVYDLGSCQRAVAVAERNRRNKLQESAMRQLSAKVAEVIEKNKK